MIEIEKLKFLRQQIGLTQKELASLAGVSQSLIAKIESKCIDPGYSLVKKIFFTIEGLINKEEKEAKDIMTREIIFCSPEDKITDVIKKMTLYKISQIPVKEKENIIGIVSETSILEKGMSKDKKAKDLMEIAPPIIPLHTKVSIVYSLLKQYPAIIVSDWKRLNGIITKSDVLKGITK